MKQSLNGVTLLSIICIGIASLPAARAAHATNFLDELQYEVTNRVANAATNSSRTARRTLALAGRFLNRNTRTLLADAGVLASAVDALNPRFAQDAELTRLENDAIAAYWGEAQFELFTLQSLVGTNRVKRYTSNLLARAESRLASAAANTNSLPVRARALLRAYGTLGLLGKTVRGLFQPQAPVSLAGVDITFYENAIVNDQTTFYFHTRLGSGEEFYYYEAHHPEELGTWTYERTSSNTALFHCDPDFPPGYTTPHDIALVFTSPNTGTFTARNALGEEVRGRFVVTH